MFDLYFYAALLFVFVIVYAILSESDAAEETKKLFNSNMRDIINERYDSDYYDEWFVFINNDDICEVTLAKKGIIRDTFKVSFNHVLNY